MCEDKIVYHMAIVILGSEDENHQISYGCNHSLYCAGSSTSRNISSMKNKLLVGKFQSVTVHLYSLTTHVGSMVYSISHTYW